MVGFLISLCIATALGFLAGIGVGGGSLLLLWLTQVVKIPQPQARILNLLFFLPAAMIASLLRARRKEVPLRIVLPGAICGCISAAILSILSSGWDIDLLKKLLGWLLIAIGLREVFYRPRKAR